MKPFASRILVFALLTQAFSFLGLYLKQVQNIEGAELIFLCTPLLLSFIFARFDAKVHFIRSFRAFKFKESWRWYIFALLIYPSTYLLATLIAQSTRLISSSEWQTYPPLVLMALPSAMLFAFFEEFTWRGHLDNAFEVRAYSPQQSSLWIGIIWVMWHLPLFTFNYYDIYSAAPLRSFMLFAITLLITAQVYGLMKRRSKSVWTSVIMHGTANAFVFPLIIGKNAIWSDIKLEWLILPIPASIMSLLLWLSIWFAVRRNINRHNPNDSKKQSRILSSN